MTLKYNWGEQKRRAIEAGLSICLKKQYERDKKIIESRDSESTIEFIDGILIIEGEKIERYKLTMVGEYLAGERLGRKIRQVAAKFDLKEMEARKILRAMSAKKLITRFAHDREYRITEYGKKTLKIKVNKKNQANCKICDTQFEPINNRVTCGDECREELTRIRVRGQSQRRRAKIIAERSKKQKPLKMSDCIVCSNKFKSSPNKKTCSDECRKEVKRKRDAQYKARKRSR